MLSGQELVIALVIVFVGATVLGTVGFGLGVVTAPVFLMLVDPQSTVVMVNSFATMVLICVLVQNRRHLDLRRARGLALGGLAAVPIGVLALEAASPATLRITIGVMILSLAPLTVFNVRLPLSQRRFSGPVVGFLTSLMITTLAIGAPLVAIYVIAQKWPPQAMRASLAIFFLPLNVAALALYGWVGLVHLETLANIGVLVPSLAAGVGLATLIAGRINAQVFRYVASTLVMLGGGVLVGREIAGL